MANENHRYMQVKNVITRLHVQLTVSINYNISSAFASEDLYSMVFWHTVIRINRGTHILPLFLVRVCIEEAKTKIELCFSDGMLVDDGKTV